MTTEKHGGQEAMMTALQAIQTSVQAVAQAVQATNTKIEETGRKLDKIDQNLNGTGHADDPGIAGHVRSLRSFKEKTEPKIEELVHHKAEAIAFKKHAEGELEELKEDRDQLLEDVAELKSAGKAQGALWRQILQWGGIPIALLLNQGLELVKFVVSHPH